MNRHIVRFFSYVLYSVVLLLVAGGAGWLLQLLLEYTPLHGSSGLPTTTDLVRALVLWGVSWVIGLPLVAYLSRFIGRDMQSDPQAGGSGVRAFFLNVVEAPALPLAVGVAAFAVIQRLGLTFMEDVTGAAAFVILSLALVAWLEGDRRRAQAGTPAARVFQRLHLYGVQLILLLMLTSTWLSASQRLIDALVFGSRGAMSVGAPVACGGFTACPVGPNLLSLAAAALWIAAFWIGSGLLARGDHASRWYQATQLLGLAWGLGYVLFSIERGIELLLLFLARVSLPVGEITGPAAMYDFASPLIFGLLVSGVYGFWLMQAGGQQAPLASRLALWAETIATFLLAVVFWCGVGLALANAFEWAFGTQPDVRAWIGAAALVIAGIAYIPLSMHLSSRSLQRSISEPRRGFVLAMLSAGILTGVIGAGVALYMLGTSLLGSPLANWQQAARSGLAAFLVGATLVGIYLGMALYERFFEWLRRGKREAHAPVPTSPVTTPTEAASVPSSGGIPAQIDAVLDALLAGTISRDEAEARIRAITRTHAGALS